VEDGLIIKKVVMKEKIKSILLNWNAVIIAFILMMYSVILGLSGNVAEAQYSAHWPGTILLFSLAINQIIRRR
jgi:hypothetical protein|tara:strand:- start:26 stop:244 length:219 start_codon:yes stop_codon:yes gene_type:complete